MHNDIGVLYFYTCSESVERLDEFLPMFCSISFGSSVTTLDKTTCLSLRRQIISLDFFKLRNPCPGLSYHAIVFE